MIAPQEQGKGLGTAAVVAILRYLSEEYAGYSELCLTVNCENMGAINCYLKAGFVKAGKKYLGGPSGPQHIMKAVI